ncbi:MAG: class I SAM-dependent methyltransferase [Candidatus Omnitrophica bacterium]|nr:class I SAM-dependent methyltransferase [Candidatus Omnitrophota bacterium]
MSFIKQVVKFYYSKPLIFLLHNCLYWLKRELKDCDTVLDLGCGYDSLLKYQRMKFSVGVDYFMPYILESKDKSIHHHYIRADIREIEFKPRSFDAVLLLNVLEHFNKQEGYRLIERVSRFAYKKIIITTPNGYLNQIVNSENPLQEHHSGWKVEELKALGFKAKGLSGFKIFRTAIHCEDRKHYLKRVLSTVRFRPRIFWLLIAEISQIAAYRFPHLCFEVFYVKRI